ncbi:hypothetical protein J6590_053981 [Homalodisca vitripennis]|nr:hypothetical protein J6590_053981 [Homalodisca vitripennis]
MGYPAVGAALAVPDVQLAGGEALASVTIHEFMLNYAQSGTTNSKPPGIVLLLDYIFLSTLRDEKETNAVVVVEGVGWGCLRGSLRLDPWAPLPLPRGWAIPSASHCRPARAVAVSEVRIQDKGSRIYLDVHHHKLVAKPFNAPTEDLQSEQNQSKFKSLLSMNYENLGVNNDGSIRPKVRLDASESTPSPSLGSFGRQKNEWKREKPS